ncbi:hypothetical protein SGRA_0763 [Saprospira grandis str. Lewin]|uniref:Uncharacterized protein n=1 Tax=Saprospira grandis (strain Lewin) TaxID=984262 RepID=H6L1G0_SAPGL|nr:hypothetical protein SGRA_0763 [Saprospira grandis str. Lewin]
MVLKKALSLRKELFLSLLQAALAAAKARSA